MILSVLGQNNEVLSKPLCLRLIRCHAKLCYFSISLLLILPKIFTSNLENNYVSKGAPIQKQHISIRLFLQSNVPFSTKTHRHGESSNHTYQFAPDCVAVVKFYSQCVCMCFFPHLFLLIYLRTVIEMTGTHHVMHYDACALTWSVLQCLFDLFHRISRTFFRPTHSTFTLNQYEPTSFLSTPYKNSYTCTGIHSIILYQREITHKIDRSEYLHLGSKD